LYSLNGTVALFYFWTIRANMTEEELAFLKARFVNLQETYTKVIKAGEEAIKEAVEQKK
jgi:hypothetical protein